VRTPDTTNKNRTPDTTNKNRTPDTTDKNRAPDTTDKNKIPDTTDKNRAPDTTNIWNPHQVQDDSGTPPFVPPYYRKGEGNLIKYAPPRNLIGNVLDIFHRISYIRGYFQVLNK
jgi:hypothetical protein